MPTDFHKIMDNISLKTQNSFTFIDDILIVTKWTAEHMTKVEEAIKMLDDKGVRLKFEKRNIAKNDTEYSDTNYQPKE